MKLSGNKMLQIEVMDGCRHWNSNLKDCVARKARVSQTKRLMRRERSVMKHYHHWC